jgi:hypothetical protein
MDRRQAIALLTFVNQVDPRVMLNEASAEVWGYALTHVELPTAKQAVMEYYKSVEGVAASPAAIRKRAAAIQSARRAFEDAKSITSAEVWGDPTKLRSLDPKRWDDLAAQGAAERRRQLGIAQDAT